MKKMWLTTETTGLDPVNDSLLNVVFTIEIDGKTEPYIFNYGIRPSKDVAIKYLESGYAIFTPEQLASSNFESPQEVLKKLNEVFSIFVDKFDKEDKFVIVSHSTHFHADFLRNFFTKNGDNYFGSWFTTEPLDIKQMAVITECNFQKRMFQNYKLDTLYNSIPDTLKIQTTLPDGTPYPEKLGKIKAVYNSLLKHLTDIPF